MAKVKDEAAKEKSAEKAAARGGTRAPGRFSSLVTTLLRADLYKPLQGRNARLWTGIALGVIVLLGVWQLHQQLDSLNVGTQTSITLGIAAVLSWLVFRLVNWPPFADFLIATEAEMNKVSWISRQDLKRATGVVITTVVLLSILLFGVDVIWQAFLAFIGVMRIRSEGFGSTS